MDRCKIILPDASPKLKQMTSQFEVNFHVRETNSL